jgi:sulfhydrogenase subunit beta (sulfur reductase)
MAAVKLKMKDVPQFLEGARAAGYGVFAPARAPEGWAFTPYEGGPVNLDGYLLTTASVKGFALPQLEALLSYDGDGGRPAPTPEGKRLIFGVRPCDARALALVDRVYRDRGFRDTHYLARRDNTVLVVRACYRPAPTCFCTSVGGGPADATGADVMAYEAGDDLLLEATSSKGEKFLKAAKAEPAPEAGLAAAKAPYAEVAAEMKPPWDLDAVRPRLYENFDSPAWEEIASRCVSCGACTFVCPSCHCFDVADEGKHGRGVRLRFWDACTQSLFTLHASGHNPRERKAARYRQRVLHKFYYFHDNWGENLCVGCGRCVVACPANVDIREAVTLVAEAA